MTNVEVPDTRPDARSGYRVDVSRGERIGRVSPEWFRRPADERYLSLDALMASVKGRAERTRFADSSPQPFVNGIRQPHLVADQPFDDSQRRCR